MRRLLNEQTGTVHKSRQGTTSDEATSDEAICGALQHVPPRQVTSITGESSGVGDGTRTDDRETRVGENVERCGRCFEEAGGY